MTIDHILITCAGNGVSVEGALFRGIITVDTLYIRRDGWTLAVPTNAGRKMHEAARRMFDWQRVNRWNPISLADLDQYDGAFYKGDHPEADCRHLTHYDDADTRCDYCNKRSPGNVCPDCARDMTENKI